MKIAARIGCAVLALVMLFVLVEAWYFPRYRRRGFDVSPGTHDAIRLMSANVRCWSPTDLGRRSWFFRASLLLRNIADAQPDVIGFQEVTRIHYAYLTDHLKGYASVLAYRDGSFLSEGCPIFYNTQKFTCTDSGSFWLSETPETCSKDWGAAFPRICSYVLLREIDSGKAFAVFNTHLDHVSDTARIRGIGVVLDKLRAFGDLPCVLMGDLNAGENTETYRAATELFDDAKYRTENPPKGPTYQNWGQKPDAENIDYFLISKSGIDVQDYRIVTTLYDGVYPSDHFPIALEIKLL
ncbi:MAG: endonuclease/exonuclease/phosphatase family protein [Clostridia bacterium]|nr:endonuclease/exonuclease/phosphatase family protein [Clostridia bacterium]